MFLVYEKNYLSYGDVDCIEETDMKLFSNKDEENQCILKIVIMDLLLWKMKALTHALYSLMNCQKTEMIEVENSIFV